MNLYCWCLGLGSCDWVSCAAMPTGIASAANRYTTVIHIQVRDFMFFSSLLREWRSWLARSEIADENLRQVQAPERAGIPITSSAPARTVPELELVRRSSRLTGKVVPTGQLLP